MNVVDKTKKYLDVIKRDNKKLNIFLHINKNVLREAEEIEKKKKKGRLYGQVIAVKSNICVFGLECNAASNVLEGWIAPYDATVISKIKMEDGLIIGMVNMDEFAAGGSGENSAFGCAVNPTVPDYIPGGSSSGSACAVVAGMCDLSLGSDTGGSIRNPASNCGVIGVKPSYGAVSRYGLMDLSMSLDQIGVFGKKIEDVALLLDVIKGKDIRDTSSVDSEKIKLVKPDKINLGRLVLKGVDKKIQALIDEQIEKISKRNKWKIVDVDIDGIDLAVQTYYLLVYAEFFSATRRFDGLRYGKKIENACGKEVLRRILGGSEITRAEFEGQYYEKALQVKELIARNFAKAFDKVDAIVCPTVPGLPWKLGEGNKMPVEKVYAFDALTIPANLAGICAISIPAGKIKNGKDNIPVGLQVMCNSMEESKLLSVSKEFE